MTGRERLLAVLKGEQVDRVPIAPFIFTNFIEEFYESKNVFSFAAKNSSVDPIAKGIELYEHFGFDIILRTANVWDYLTEASDTLGNWQVSEQRDGNDESWVVTHIVTTPEKKLTQKKNYKKVAPHEAVEAIVEYYIKDESDFDQFVKYQPPVPTYDCSEITRARKLLGDRGIVAPWAQGAFNSASFYRKVDELILDAYMQPDFFHRMMIYFSERMYRLIMQLAAAGADMICCGGNVANGTTAGPHFFREFVLPYETPFTRKVKDLGVYYLYHNCGDAASLFDIYSDVGMDLYETLTGPPFGDTDLDTALRKFDRHITLSGNIDQIDFLITAKPDEVKTQVKKTLDTVKRRGNFILAASDYFSEGTPYDNVKAFADAGLQYGSY